MVHAIWVSVIMQKLEGVSCVGTVLQMKSILFIFCMYFCVPLGLAQGAYPKASQATVPATEVDKEFIGIQEKLGDFIPLDHWLTDDQGRKYQLKDLFDKPVLFGFVYYRCPGICSPLLAGKTRVLESIDIVPGIDFNVVTLSIDPTEDYKLAADKKANYLTDLKRNLDPDAWRWSVADQETIDALTNAFGWKYKKTEDGHFTHSGSLMAVSPSGKIARYLYGDKFLPFDVKMALAEAAEERTGPTVARLLKFCFSYDPEGRKYVFNILRVVGTLLLLWIVGIFVFVSRAKKVNPLDRFEDDEDIEEEGGNS